ncbi:MAG: hypothetical protein QXG98_05210 [Candidatus Micrarchaeia archaeon]
MRRGAIEKLLREHGRLFSEELGIDLASGRMGEVFKWFLAAILFAAPIRAESAARTYREFERRGVLSPQKILATGWDGLVQILDAGGYTRYDFKTADKLLEVMGKLMKDYGGDLNRLHAAASDARDLEARIMGLGKGIGPATVSIFLREMRGLWKKADPAPTALERMAARRLGIPLARLLKALPPRKAAKLQAALARVGRKLR